MKASRYSSTVGHGTSCPSLHPTDFATSTNRYIIIIFVKRSTIKNIGLLWITITSFALIHKILFKPLVGHSQFYLYANHLSSNIVWLWMQRLRHIPCVYPYSKSAKYYSKQDTVLLPMYMPIIKMIKRNNCTINAVHAKVKLSRNHTEYRLIKLFITTALCLLYIPVPQ